MILTRLLNNIKQQNWFAVGLELAIVILGIYLGLQVNQWQERLEQKEAEKQLIVRLQEDLNALETENLNVVKAIESQIKRFDTTISFVKAPESWRLGLKEWRSQLEPLMGYPDPVVEFPVYEEILATASMSIISDTQIRQDLTRLKTDLRNSYDSNDAFLTVYGPSYQFLFEKLTDLQEFPEYFATTSKAEQRQLVRHLYTMRNTIRFVRFHAEQNAKSAAKISGKLAELSKETL